MQRLQKVYVSSKETNMQRLQKVYVLFVLDSNSYGLNNWLTKLRSQHWIYPKFNAENCCRARTKMTKRVDKNIIAKINNSAYSC